MVPRDEHSVSRREIDPCALKVLYRLSEQGFTAYLVGGGVRDLLLGRRPKDFDVATDAHPNQIRRLFRNCFLVGRRFRLAHVKFGDQVIETSTFRSEPDEKAAGEDLYQHHDNTFGTPAEDARRRDFTINALFYDIKTFHVIDHVGGLKDLSKGLVRAIGDPVVRFQEDPVRMLRAIRFASRLHFTIEGRTRRAISRCHAEIAKASPPRLLEEILRLFGFSSAAAAFRMMYDTGLLADLLPEVAGFVRATGESRSPLWSYLEALDAAAEGQEPGPSMKLACLYLPLFRRELERRSAGGRPVSYLDVARDVLESPSRRLGIPRKIFFDILHALAFQQRLEDPNPRRTERLFSHEVFPVSLRLYGMAAEAGQADAATAARWRDQYDAFLAGHGGRTPGGDADQPRRGPRRRRSRPRRRDRGPSQSSARAQTAGTTGAAAGDGF